MYDRVARYYSIIIPNIYRGWFYYQNVASGVLLF